MLAWALLMSVASATPSLDEGRSLFQALHYEEALTRLQAATREPHLSHAELREAFDLLARTQAALGDLSGAEATFTELLTRDASAPPPSQAAPKIREAFRLARARVFPPGTVRLTRRSNPEGRLLVELFDPWGAVARVELHQVGGGRIATVAAAPSMEFAVPSSLSLCWLLAVGASGDTVGTLGSQVAPLRLGHRLPRRDTSADLSRPEVANLLPIDRDDEARVAAARVSASARGLVAEGRDDEALELVQQSKDLGRDELLQVWRVEACAAARTGDPERAATAWKKLFVLAAPVAPPDECEAAWSSWFAARAWSRAQPAFHFTPAVSLDAGRWQATVRRTDDVLGLAQRVRFHLRKSGGWVEQVAPFDDDVSRVSEEGVLAWWAEVLGTAGVVSVVGSKLEPLAPSNGDAPRRVELTPPEPAAPLPVVTRPSWRVPVGVTTGVLGVIAAGVGVGLGVMARADQTTLENLPVGRVSTLTQVDALRLAGRQRSEATGANVLFGTAAGLAVTSALVLLLGHDAGGPTP
jgi:tetratricopeptide (TPR) repeat protein